jgi:hypothetical protein
MTFAGCSARKWWKTTRAVSIVECVPDLRCGHAERGRFVTVNGDADLRVLIWNRWSRLPVRATRELCFELRRGAIKLTEIRLCRLN